MQADGKILAQMVKRMKKRGADPLRPLVDAYLIERGSASVRHVIEKIDMKPAGRVIGVLSPSTIGGCEREAVFRFTGTKGRRRLDPDQELVFEHGTWTHHKWQAIFRDMERVLGKKRFRVISIEERVSYPELFIAGSLDALVKIEGKRWLIDIKSINNSGFTWIQNTDKPIEHHVKQLVSYLRARGVPRGLLLYENKNNQETKCFVVFDDEEQWLDVIAWCESVISQLRHKKLPARHPDCAHGTLKFERCPFAAVCFSDRTEREIRNVTYKDFVGADETWERARAEHANQAQ